MAPIPGILQYLVPSNTWYPPIPGTLQYLVPWYPPMPGTLVPSNTWYPPMPGIPSVLAATSAVLVLYLNTGTFDL